MTNNSLKFEAVSDKPQNALSKWREHKPPSIAHFLKWEVLPNISGAVSSILKSWYCWCASEIKPIKIHISNYIDLQLLSLISYKCGHDSLHSKMLKFKVFICSWNKFFKFSQWVIRWSPFVFYTAVCSFVPMVLRNVGANWM